MAESPQPSPGAIRRVIATLILGLAAASAQATVVAFDMVDSASRNLIGFTNSWTDAFSSAEDGFQRYRRGVSASTPATLLDDSLSSSDSLGVIGEDNTDTFFGVVDTVNADNQTPVSAAWVFDIGGFSDLSLAIDMGAMGDFESSDTFSWSYAIDAGPSIVLFESLVDQALAATYTLASGMTVLLNDPMQMGGITLTNQLQTFSAAVAGIGSVLVLTLTANTDGGSEAFAFQNLIIEGTAAGGSVPIPEPSALTLLGLGLLGMSIVLFRRRNRRFRRKMG